MLLVGRQEGHLAHPVVLDKIQEGHEMVVCVCWVDAETVLCLRFMPVMHRHQLALCESEKEGSLCEMEAPPCWYSLSLSRPTYCLHEVVDST